MKQYIDKDILVAEIERIKKEECPIDTYEGRIKLFYFERFLSFLNTLEVKEMDLDSEITLWANAIPEIRLDDVERLATYFFELGLKTKGE